MSASDQEDHRSIIDGFGVQTSFDLVSLALRRGNYEVHLVQHGIDRFAVRHPWWGLPIAFGAFAMLWGAYWMLYPIAIAALLITRCVRPVELHIRG